ncbi:MAG: CvpA family protein [Lactobacillus sp.]|jgi:uncharacterized membrane protein required for colicin V production|uniref:CvpA family protein n=1 Tax=Lacticaseibacillus suilingensis TaxID=2799577 RepID=A0ABW4BI76_9LACO|nr:CvpA family protein [Lacticaseibacillus suilingensis]MCI1893741.1 CvpA family protein [Lactobacillus sp.]MCI1916709.1 CvpA family protein [Lactobacillus sp.]MCI1941376.1 CvpA family protein [Lactobacillus sp.]MCI1971921.1 CvpA family protein [Lactobacillus sp.]MCI2016572.1 CvpA family protein [Lactobacillus sp.]
MLSLAILLALAYFFYEGAERGIWLQLFHTGGYLLSIGLASLLYRPIAGMIALWVPYPSATQQSQFVFFTNKVGLTLDEAFYRGVAFICVLALGWLITRFAALWVHDLKYKRADRMSFVTGGLLNLLMGYVFIFLLLYLVALVPMAGLQNLLANSFMGRTMVRYSVGLTTWITQLWIG